jgi:peptidyl-dipeptidase A
MKCFKIITLLSLFFIVSCSSGPSKKEAELKNFIEQLNAKLKPLYKEKNIADWNASITGLQDDYKKSAELELKIREIFSDKKDFEFVRKMKESNGIKDSLLARQLDLLYIGYASEQIDDSLRKKMVELSNQVQQKFNITRPKIDGNELTDNDIKDILKKETNSDKRKRAWEASKGVSSVVEKDLLELVKLRNEYARSLGYKNFYVMSLGFAEQNEEELLKLFDELDNLTSETFKKLKDEMDIKLAERYKLSIDKLRPWHYEDPFFQEAPQIGKVNFDKYYKDKDVVELGKMYYASINMDVIDVLKRSDLYEKKGKNPHAFCTNIDREGDIRVLMNVRNDSKWMETTLHELGHAVYDKYIDSSLPYLLRENAHIFTTEAIAMLNGRQATNSEYLGLVAEISEKEKKEIMEESFKQLRLQELIFSRWCQVMMRFERELYSNPEQDLNQVWWDLVEKYQFITRPENRNKPDWASKIHFTISPVYYHNYMLGSLFASQLQNYIVKNVVKANSNHITFMNKPEVGEYLKIKVFAPGKKYKWNEYVKYATGEYLTAKYFAEQFVVNPF